MNTLHNFTPGAALIRPQHPLNLDQLRHIAPSAFAGHKHESRSDKYVHIPTVNIIEGMVKAGFYPYKAMQSHTRIADRQDFTKHLIRFREANADMVVGDTFPEVILINSHDGSSAYQLMAGFFRLVCSNGLIVADSMQDALKIPHKGNIIQEVIDGSNRIVNGAHRSIEAITRWSQLALTSGEQDAFAEAARTVRFMEDGEVSTPITAAQLLAPRRDADRDALPGMVDYRRPAHDLWHTLNVVQENVIKGGLRGRRANNTRMTTRAIGSIDADVKLNKALWTLAERMEELKAA